MSCPPQRLPSVRREQAGQLASSINCACSLPAFLCPVAERFLAPNPLLGCRYKLNYTQELRGLGIANLFGAMFNCYTTTGSFSRSAVNNSVG